MNFNKRAEVLKPLNHSAPPFAADEPIERQGKLTYLQPGDTWVNNDIHDSSIGVMVVGSSSLFTEGGLVTEGAMVTYPRRYQGVAS